MSAPPQAASQTLRVRPGRPGEADALMAIVRRTVAAMQAAGLDQWDEHYPNREVLEDDLARRALLVLEQHGAPVALLTLDTWQPPEHEGQPWRCSEGVCNIHRVMVDPALQSQGLGARLMQAAKEAGYAAVHMDTLQGNAGARRFYARLGFEERGTTVSAYMGGKAYTLLEKCL